jgi:hypothetical protein
MPHYFVTKRRPARNVTPSAQEALAGESNVTVLDASNPEMVLIEVAEDAALHLRQKLGDDYFVEPEIRRGLH